MDPIKKEIEKIRDILMNADPEAVTCQPSSFKSITYGDSTYYDVPASYHITINYTKLAQAIYDGGYRKHEQKDRV